MRVYLAGAIRDRDDFGKTWRDAFESLWGDYFEVVNPLDLHDASDVELNRNGDYPDTPDSPDPSEIIAEDKQEILKSDVLYAHWDDRFRHCGTPMEIYYAYENDTPVVVEYISDQEDPSDVSQASIWLTDHSDYISYFQSDCVEWIVNNVGDSDA